MADKKKMSVAEILAAARKMDAGGDQQQQPPESETAEVTPPPAEESTPAAQAAPPKPSTKPSTGGRPSVAEMLTAARAEKKADPPTKKESPKPTPKATSPKPSAAAKSKSPAAAQGSAGGPLDTASILAAARKSQKAGPISKAEAARQKEEVRSAPSAAKTKPQVPPMPVKPAYARQPAPAKKAAPVSANEDRRGFLTLGWGALTGVGVLWTLAFARFMYPNVLREPPSRFKVGFPGDFAAGTVEVKFKAQFGVWIVNAVYNGSQQLVALKSVCTHLGCTPNWLEAEQKFKCPCHGSGFYKEGINFEGPAPRPLERYAIRVADDGQVEVDKSRIFQEEMGQWNDPASFIPV